ncbi:MULTISPECIES: hypothetical protein [unclassified Salinisphaera]|uniref:hypothetical protein n=1 Tax=unclassified Salinisphaera TaxID=2649847 RepID=UPI00334167EA
MSTSATIRCLSALLIGLILVGCTRYQFPQRMVKFSDHEMEPGKLFSMSYPADLRASTLSLRLSPAMPQSVREDAALIWSEFKQATSKLETCESGLTKGFATKCETERKRVEKLSNDFAQLAAIWGNIRILAEPPPDVAVTADLTFDLGKDADKSDIVKATAAAEAVAKQINLSNESDVKRHLMYRLNEAFYNNPTWDDEKYAALFVEIVRHKPTPTPPSATPDFAQICRTSKELAGKDLSKCPDVLASSDTKEEGAKEVCRTFTTCIATRTLTYQASIE